MKKICFGKNITSINNRITHLTDRDKIKNTLKEVYRFPQNIVDASNCFNGCVNLTKFEAELPDSVQNISSSFEGCVNFYRNISIPSECIDMSKSFKGAGIKGSFSIPRKVTDMEESFKDTKLNEVIFDENVSYFNNFKESFFNCSSLSNIVGNLPSQINLADGAFFNTGIKDVNFLGNSSIINNGKNMFKSCVHLKSSSVDLNIKNANGIFDGCVRLETVKNFYSETMDDSFKNCENLLTVGNIKGNSFSNSWNGCRSLKSIGKISGNLKFQNSFSGCFNYSDILYLDPINDSNDNVYLSMNDSDKTFLDTHALRIYGIGHGLENELNFQNAHLEKGDYISGYCDPENFEISASGDVIYFSNHNSNIKSLVIPKFFRNDLLDSSTKYSVIFHNAFKNKSFDNVLVYGMTISNNSFYNSTINDLNISSNSIIGSQGFSNAIINKLSIVNGNVNKFGSNSFRNAIIRNGYISCNINTIEANAFKNIQGNLYFDNINTIGVSSFENVYGNLYFKGMNIISNSAFKNFNGGIQLNDNIKNHIDLSLIGQIGSNAFYNSTIKSLYIPDDKELVNNSLAGMNYLTDLNTCLLNISYFNTAPINLVNVILRGNNYGTSAIKKCLSSAKNIYLTDKSFIFAESQFSEMTNLKQVWIPAPNDSYNLPNSVFENCTNLIGIVCLNNVGNIPAFYINGTSIFKNCKSLKHVYIKGNESYRLADSTSFSILEGCDSLQKLIFHYNDANLLDDEYLSSGGRTHAARFFNAIEYYTNNNITNGTNLHYIGYGKDSDDNYTYAYLNKSKVPNNLKTINATNVYYTSKTFCGLNKVENITMNTPTSINLSLNGDINYGNTFEGCNSLKNLTMYVGNRTGYGRRLSLENINIPNISSVNANISFRTITSYGHEDDIPDGFKNLSLMMSVGDADVFKSYNAINLIPKIPMNYKSNITFLPRIYALYSTTHDYKGKVYYNYQAFTNKSFPTNGIAFVENSVIDPGFLKDNKYYYLLNNTIVYGHTWVNNCVFWIDRMMPNASYSNNCFIFVNNSKIYCNGFTYSGGVGNNTQVISKSFNILELIENDNNELNARIFNE